MKQRCKSCGGVAKQGRATKSKKDPTKNVVGYLYCPRCGWSNKPKEVKKKR